MRKISLCLIAAVTWVSPALAECPARIIKSLAPVMLADHDCAIGFDRSAASRVTLPPHPANGKVIEIDDLVGNFNSYPVTMIPNSGQNIAGLPGNAVLNQNGVSWSFRFFATGRDVGIWSISQK